MSSSLWSKRLEKRLTALADGASKESLQTLARWVGFNRKHAKDFMQTLCTAVSSSPSMARSWMYWQLLDQLLLQDKNDPTKFDRTEALRMELGDQVIVSWLRDGLSGELLLKVKPLLEEWDAVNVFGGPTMMNQIKRAAAMTADSKKNEIPKSAPIVELEEQNFPVDNDDTLTEDAPMEDAPMEDVPEKDVPDKEATTAKPFDQSLVENTTVTGSVTPLKEARRQSIVDFDFEAHSIPAGEVDAKEFLEPCKAVATLQITRDLRSDSTVHLRSLLTSIPKHIREDMETYKKQWDETGEMPEIDEGKVEQVYSVNLSSEILDLSIEEALDGVRSFREIVKKLRAARKKLFHLLIRSRCDFGSRQAAEAFMALDVLTEKLEQRRGPLLDAMDLEGLEPPKEEPQEASKPLEPFIWYNPDEPVPKRQRLE